MFYFRYTLQLHDHEKIEFVGATEVENERFDERTGNGGHTVEIAAWSPMPFVAVVTGNYDFGQKIGQKAYNADPLPHTVRETEVPVELVQHDIVELDSEDDEFIIEDDGVIALNRP